MASVTISMVAHTNALMSSTLDQDQDDIYIFNSDQGYFCGARFSRPLTSNDYVSYVLKDVI